MTDKTIENPSKINEFSKPKKKSRSKKKEDPITTPTEDRPLTYKERLDSIKVSMDDAMSIIDSVIKNDVYKETVKLSKDTDAVVSTRDVRFNDKLNKVIDELKSDKVAVFSQVSSKYQLAGSLVSYAGQQLPAFTPMMEDVQWEEVMNARLKFVEQIPSPVFLALVGKLAKFDLKMTAVFSEGYEENF